MKWKSSKEEPRWNGAEIGKYHMHHWRSAEAAATIHKSLSVLWACTTSRRSSVRWQSSAASRTARRPWKMESTWLSLQEFWTRFLYKRLQIHLLGGAAAWPLASSGWSQPIV
jgi:hypothetical protein